MNQELINELAIQSGGIWRGGHVEQPNGDSVWTEQKSVDLVDMDLNKFSKLMVKDFLFRLADARLEFVWDLKTDEVFKQVVAKIKTHYGVEK